MKIQKLSMLLSAIGIFIILVFTYKYFIVADFTGMWLVGIGIGFGSFIVAYIYSWMRDIDKRINKLNIRIDAFSSWFVKNKEF